MAFRFKIPVFFLIYIFLFSSAEARTISYKNPKNGSGFEVQVPNGWRTERKVENNKVSYRFSNNNILVLVHAEQRTRSKKEDIESLINNEALPYLAEFDNIRINKQSVNPYKNWQYELQWQVSKQGKNYVILTWQTTIDQVTYTITCFSPESVFETRRMYFENILLSFHPFSGVDQKQTEDYEEYKNPPPPETAPPGLKMDKKEMEEDK